MTERDLVFISYSHRKKAWLDKLLTIVDPYVSDGRFRVWADPYIEEGARWERTIADAIRRTRVAVLLVSPEFLASDFIKREELPTLLTLADADQIKLFCVPVSASAYEATPLARYQWAWDPLKPLDELGGSARNRALITIAGKLAKSFNSVPTENLPRVAVTIDRVRDTQTQRGAENGPGDLFGVPEQRPHFVLREDNDLVLVGRLVSESNGDAHQSNRKIGLSGPAGVGKSVLAIASARAEDVRRAFPDGIHWVTLGQRPNVLDALRGIVRDLGGEAEALSDVPRAKRALATLLARKTCLLVLDDLWELAHADVFELGDTQSRLLITTRDARLLTALGAREHRVEALSKQLALRVLALWAEQTEAQLPEAASCVADHCGGIPLALSLAGARVRDGLTWADLKNALERGDLEFLDHPYGSVLKSMRVSFDALLPIEAERLLGLAIFPENAGVPEATVIRLWSYATKCAPDQGRSLLTNFSRKGLVYLSDGETERTVTCHALQRAFLRLLVKEPEALHSQLLKSYALELPPTVSPARPWYSFPRRESYLWGYLAYHLAEAGLTDELAATVKDLRYIGRKLALFGSHAIESDLEMTSELTADETIPLLKKALAQEAHLFRGLRDVDITTTLHTRLPQEVAKRLANTKNDGPRVKVLWPMPDLAGTALVRTLEGHSDSVNCCVIDARGEWIVSGSDDGTLRICDAATGDLIRTLTEPDAWITSCAMDGQHRWVAASAERGVLLWDARTGEKTGLLQGHGAAVTCCAMTATGEWIVSGSKDRTLCVWERASGKLIHTLEGHTDTVCSCAITGDFVVSGSHDRTLRLWDARRGELLHVFEGHTDSVSCCAVDAEGRWIVSGSWDRTLRVWDLRSRLLLGVLEGHAASVECCAIDDVHGRIVSGSWDNSLRMWSIDSGEQLARYDGHADGVNCCAMGPNGLIVSGSWDETIRIWRVSSDEPKRERGASNWLTSASIRNQGEQIVTGARDCTVRLLEASGEVVRTFLGHATAVSCCAIDPEGRWIAGGSDDKVIRVWDAASGAIVHSLAGHLDAINCCAIDPHGRWVISGSLDKTLRVWGLAEGKLLSTIQSRESVNCCAVDASGGWLVFGSEDGALVISNLAEGQAFTLRCDSGPVNCCAVTPGGDWVVAGYDDRLVRLWDVKNKRLARQFAGNADTINSCDIHAESKRILTGSDDNSMRIWDAESGDCILTLRVDGDVRACIWSGAGHRFFGAGSRGMYMLEFDEDSVTTVAT